MIELTVKNYLDSVLTVPVFMEKPEVAPVEYVLVEQTSERMENQISFASVAIQSYAKRKYEAAQLIEEVKAAMKDIITLSDVTSCKLNNSYPFTDTSKKQYRYQAVFDLVFYDDLQEDN